MVLEKWISLLSDPSVLADAVRLIASSWQVENCNYTS